MNDIVLSYLGLNSIRNKFENCKETIDDEIAIICISEMQ